jgi:N-acetylneuraminic acid mutarotase
MYHHLLRPGLVTLTVLGLAACGDDTTTQPELPAQPTGTAAALAVATNSWISRADMLTNRTDLTVATVTNRAGQSVLYAMFGRNPNGVPIGTVAAYNVATNTWTFTGSGFKGGLAFTNGAGVINGKIYVSGGFTNYHLDKLSLALLMYDPATNTWTGKRDLPSSTNQYGGGVLFGARGVTGVIGGKLYVFTACFEESEKEGLAWEGCSERGPGFFRYNPGTDRWTSLPSPFSPLTRSPYAGGVIGGKFYVMGGTAGTYAGWLRVYDPATNQWTPKNALGLTRPGAATAVLNSKLYVMGGQRYNAARKVWETLDKTVVYDPITNAWTWRASLPSPRAGVAGSTVLRNGQARIEVVGGSRPGNNLQYIP